MQRWVTLLAADLVLRGEADDGALAADLLTAVLALGLIGAAGGLKGSTFAISESADW